MKFHSPISITLSVFLLGIASCSNSIRYGDATYERVSDFFLLSPDHFTLPEFPIDRPGQHRFQVRGLPTPIIPSEISMRSDHPASSPAENPPWKGARFEVVFYDLAGTELARHQVRPSQHDTGIWRSGASLGPTPNDARSSYTDYDVLVTVVVPSSAPGDRAYLSGGAPIVR